jgi:catechol 2,3-dioxygenase
MSLVSPIRRMAHVALRVPDLEASVAWATTIMGLRETERVGPCAYLTHGACHHSLQLIAGERSELDHIALQAHDRGALEDALREVQAAGLELVATEPQEPALDRAFRFRGPEGHVIEIFDTMRDVGAPFVGGGVQPLKFGHPTLTCEDVGAYRVMFQDVLGFRVSDVIGDELLVFMRCGVDHHGIGLQRGPSGLNHYAWQVQDIAQLARLGDVLARVNGRFIWGPGRHGAGNNLFTYHFDPAGAVVEYYADMYQVWDERTFTPGHWDLDDHRGPNLWGPTTPQELIEAFIPLADLVEVAS